MGAAKQAQIVHEEQVGAATSYLVHLGVLEQCEWHGNVWQADWSMEAYWPLAVAEWKKGQNGLVPWAAEMSVREFTDLLKAAFEEHPGDGCYACENNARD
ncbi:MAG: hypothetical protein ACREE0_22925 [Phenylobacterium sp.]